ncbi:hypothetical protein AeRB84_006457 [Aphanomyces euteiches]|nr:hypothetical protein AeRB84_006457 [Aphanomyces euteiches]
MGDSFTLTEGSFTSGRGIKLYTRKYIPSSSYSVVFLFLHGVGEHCTRFHDTFSTIAKQGIAVYALDHQGHGKSEGARFDCGSFEEFTDDIFTYDDLIRGEHASNPQVKYVVAGISFGGLLAASVAALKPELWDGLMLYAPAIGVEISWVIYFQSLFAPVLEFLIPAWEVVPAVIPDLICRNKAFVEDYVNDPLVDHNPLRIRLARSIERGMNQLKTIQNNVKMPVQIFHGDADKVTSPVLSKQFFDAIPSTQKTFTSLPGQYHCLFNEPEGAATLVATIDWLKARSKLIRGSRRDEECTSTPLSMVYGMTKAIAMAARPATTPEAEDLGVVVGAEVVVVELEDEPGAAVEDVEFDTEEYLLAIDNEKIAFSTDLSQSQL